MGVLNIMFKRVSNILFNKVCPGVRGDEDEPENKKPAEAGLES